MKKSIVQKRLCNNLTKQEKAAMEELKSRDDLVITKADKGGAVVIMDVDDYVKEANRQLDDSTFYKKLPQDPTPIHEERINNTISKFKDEGLITEKVAEGLKTNNPKTSKFSLNPENPQRRKPWKTCYQLNGLSFSKHFQIC